MEAALVAKDVKAFTALVLQAVRGDRRFAVSFLQDVVAACSDATDSDPATPKASTGDTKKAQTDATGCVVPDVPFSTPRGRFNLHFSMDGMMLHGKAGDFGPIPWDNIRHVFKLPKAGRRPPGQPPRAYHIMLPLKAPLLVGKQKHASLVLNADGKKPAADAVVHAIASDTFRSWARRRDKALTTNAAASAEVGEAEHVTLTRLFALGLGTSIEEPENDVFPVESVPAYVGFEDGAVYVSRSGLCFLPKPALFVPTEAIANANVFQGRGSGDALELHLNCRDGGNSPIVFSQILREYEPPLTKFIQRISRGSSKGGNEAHEKSDDEDSDFAVEGGSDDSDGEPPAKIRKRSVRGRKKSGGDRLISLSDIEKLDGPGGESESCSEQEQATGNENR